MARSELIQLIDSFKDETFLVVGDVMLDKYTFGSVTRISPEAPVPIFKKKTEKYTLGGAANVAANIVSLGGHALVSGVVGNDAHKEMLLVEATKKNIDVSGIVVDGSRPTTVKHRLVIGANHQLMRIDEESDVKISASIEDLVLAKVLPIIPQMRGIIFSDYVKGYFTKRIVSEILTTAKKYSVPVYADIKPQDADLFIGVDLITPNVSESVEMTGSKDIATMGERLVQRFQSDVLITRSEDGMSVFDKTGSRFDLPAKKISVFDVSGAGDTVVAVMALARGAGADLPSAAFCANVAASVVVQKAGTATLSPDELKTALGAIEKGDVTNTVTKVWGLEKWVEKNDTYSSKVLLLNKGYESSLHVHKLRDETLLVKSGRVRLELGDEVLELREGTFVRVPPGVAHSFRGEEDSVIVEISTHYDDADVFRQRESRKVV